MVLQNQYFPQPRTHPGETLEEKLEEMGIDTKEFALKTGKSEKTISSVLKGKSSTTTNMAVQFENVTKIPAQFWMNAQKDYDQYIVREKRQAVVEETIQ